ncbi:MAG: ATP-dependent Clp protease ATP-binding subunit [Halomonas sp.]|nr:AAA family ATPase [Halomonas sp.]TVP44513.1 MAG: ATP-dependent Clp protease ATP-binding subunit [Halomonas sp.]
MPFINDRLEESREVAGLEQGTRAKERPSRFRFDPARVMQRLRERIVGQEDVLNAMEAMLHVVKADIGAEERPLAVNLFLGPTGVGKTETVRLIAEAIHGRSDALCRIDMNTLAQEHYAAALTGAPPGYVGSKEGHTLFDIEAIQGSYSKPGIVLFDELEKASKEVVRSLLNVLDSGQLVLSGGTRRIDFRNTLVFMTSNIGATDVVAYRSTFEQGWRRWLRLVPRKEARVQQQALYRHFDPEFLNRIDRLLTFEKLDDSWWSFLLDIELAKLDKRLAKQQVTLQLTDGVRHWLCESRDARFGARDLARRLRVTLEPALAGAMLQYPEKNTFQAQLREQHRLVVLPT